MRPPLLWHNFVIFAAFLFVLTIHIRGTEIWTGLLGCLPGSTAWNNFAAMHGKGKSFGRLEDLTLERSGITDYQLRQILESNPRLTELKLQKCLSLTEKHLSIWRIAGGQET
jgi:hypothetical protein